MQGTQDTDTSPEHLDGGLGGLRERVLGRRALENEPYGPTDERLTAQQELGGGMVSSTENQNPIDVFAEDIKTACLQDGLRRPDHVRLLGDLDIIGLAEHGIEEMTKKDKVILAKMLAYALAQLKNGMTQLATPGSGTATFFQDRYGLSPEDKANEQESAALALQLTSLYDKVMSLDFLRELPTVEQAPYIRRRWSEYADSVVVLDPDKKRYVVSKRPNADQAA